MPIPDSMELVSGAPLVVVVPLLVELAKQQGMSVRYAGLAAIAIATLLMALAGVALRDEIGVDDLARWIVGGIVYGLAAAGLYSQRATLAAGSSPGP
jgi:hypothetical protein